MIERALILVPWDMSRSSLRNIYFDNNPMVFESFIKMFTPRRRTRRARQIIVRGLRIKSMHP